MNPKLFNKKQLKTYDRLIISESSKRAPSLSGTDRRFNVVTGMRRSSRAKNGLFVTDKEAQFKKATEGNSVATVASTPREFKLDDGYQLTYGENVLLQCNDFEYPISVPPARFKTMAMHSTIANGVIQEPLIFTDDGWYTQTMLDLRKKKTEEFNACAEKTISDLGPEFVSDLVPGTIYKKVKHLADGGKLVVYGRCLYLGEITIEGKRRYCTLDLSAWDLIKPSASSEEVLSFVARTENRTYSKAGPWFKVPTVGKYPSDAVLVKRISLHYLTTKPYLIQGEKNLSSYRNILDTMLVSDIDFMYAALNKPHWVFKKKNPVDSDLVPFDTQAIKHQIAERLARSDADQLELDS